jgi:tRNA(Ile2) C34 agmatinyltransferase TiaS
MYSPVLSETMVKTLYRLKQAQGKPMTVVVEKLLLRSIASVDKKPVCEICVKENNNDCRSCYFSCIKMED